MAEAVKLRRLQEIIEVHHSCVREKNIREELGRYRLVLVEGEATKASVLKPMLTGRTDGNKRVVFPSLPTLAHLNPNYFLNMQSDLTHPDLDDQITTLSAKLVQGNTDCNSAVWSKNSSQTDPWPMLPPSELIGKYVIVKIVKANGPTLRGIAVAVSGIVDFQVQKLSSLRDQLY